MWTFFHSAKRYHNCNPDIHNRTCRLSGLQSFMSSGLQPFMSLTISSVSPQKGSYGLSVCPRLIAVFLLEGYVFSAWKATFFHVLHLHQNGVDNSRAEEAHCAVDDGNLSSVYSAFIACAYRVHRLLRRP